MELDVVDRAILMELQEHGRVTNAELATSVGLSPSACLRRVRSLEQSGVIDGYHALINGATIDRATTVFVELSLDTQSGGQLDAFEAAIERCPEVMGCHLMSGDADYLVQVVCADVRDFERIHRDQLAKLPGVTKIKSNFALRVVCQRTSFDL